jgi:hypothetical protein
MHGCTRKRLDDPRDFRAQSFWTAILTSVSNDERRSWCRRSRAAAGSAHDRPLAKKGRPAFLGPRIGIIGSKPVVARPSSAIMTFNDDGDAIVIGRLAPARQESRSFEVASRCARSLRRLGGRASRAHDQPEAASKYAHPSPRYRE